MMTRPTKSLIKDIVPARVRIYIKLLSDKDLMRMFKITLSKLTIRAVLEIVVNSCMTR